jgi:hypothetical protein
MPRYPAHQTPRRRGAVKQIAPFATGIKPPISGEKRVAPGGVIRY